MITCASPEEILHFWFGNLSSPKTASKTNWTERMLKWRIGVYAKDHVDAEFDEFQANHLPLMNKIFNDKGWNDNQERHLWLYTSRGILASIILMDHQHTSSAYSFDKRTHYLIDFVLERNWDLIKYNVIERIFIYIAMVHPEDLRYQRLANIKWTKWASDLVKNVPKQYTEINEYVSWNFIITIYEHSITVLEFGRFPHRNIIFGRTTTEKETKWLNDKRRPPWSYSQPVPVSNGSCKCGEPGCQVLININNQKLTIKRKISDPSYRYNIVRHSVKIIYSNDRQF